MKIIEENRKSNVFQFENLNNKNKFDFYLCFLNMFVKIRILLYIIKKKINL